MGIRKNVTISALPTFIKRDGLTIYPLESLTSENEQGLTQPVLKSTKMLEQKNKID